MSAPVKVGDVIHVAEPDYMYGRGDLILRVTEVGSVQQHSDGPWVNLQGLELRTDSSQLKAEPRQALVRVRALIWRLRRRRAKS
jgi:hypothetical protein